MDENNEKIEVSIIIISFNTKKLTLECIESIKKNTDLKYEIIAIDNDSKDGSPDEIRLKYPDVKLICNNQNKGFAKANNQGIKIARGKYFLLLNSDTIVYKKSIDALFYNAENKKELAGIAPILLNYDGTLQKSFYNYPNILKIISNTLGISAQIVKIINKINKTQKIDAKIKTSYNMKIEDIEKEMEVDYVLFACILLNRKIVEKIGGLEEGMHFYHEDCEYGYRMKKNKIPIYVIPDTKITHLGGESSGNYSSKAYKSYYLGLIFFYNKHYSKLNTVVLKMFFRIYFTYKLLSSILGFGKYLYIPSNYKKEKLERQKFGKFDERLKYWYNMIILK